MTTTSTTHVTREHVSPTLYYPVAPLSLSTNVREILSSVFKQLPRKGVCFAEKQLQKVVPPKYHQVIPYLVFFLAIVIVAIAAIIFKLGSALLWQLKQRLSSEKGPPSSAKESKMQKTEGRTPSKLPEARRSEVSKDEQSHTNQRRLSQAPFPKQNKASQSQLREGPVPKLDL
ncbi:MAG: hypothetical protein HYZ47_02590 [Simkania negevensis]|nr:hypothetical protein [Simkania negevensis]